MRKVAIASMLLLTLTLAAQQLPEAATLTKQVQEAAKQRKSIQYVRELTGAFTLDGKAVTEVLSSGRRIPSNSRGGATQFPETRAASGPGRES